MESILSNRLEKMSDESYIFLSWKREIISTKTLALDGLEAYFDCLSQHNADVHVMPINLWKVPIYSIDI